jgi:hypothetical protein
MGLPVSFAGFCFRELVRCWLKPITNENEWRVLRALFVALWLALTTTAGLVHVFSWQPTAWSKSIKLMCYCRPFLSCELVVVPLDN